MTAGATRLTLIAAAPPAGGPDDVLGRDGPGDDKALARIRKASSLRPNRMRLVCSSTRAALDTARTLGWDRIMIDDGLRDRSHGEWAGRSITQLAQEEQVLFARWLRDPDFAPLGGESVTETVARAAAWLGGLPPRRSVVAVTHAALIRSFVVAGLVCPPAAWFRLDIGHGTRTVLTRNGAIWRVALVNAPL